MAQPEGGSETKSRASNNQLHLTGNSFDPRSGDPSGMRIGGQKYTSLNEKL